MKRSNAFLIDSPTLEDILENLPTDKTYHGDFSLRDMHDIVCAYVDRKQQRARDGDILRGLFDEEIEAHTTTIIRKSFEADLTDAQIECLLPVINAYVAVTEQSVADVREWLECRNTEPVRVQNLRVLGYFLYKLSFNELIVSDWQDVSELMKVFASKNGKKPSTADGLKVSLHQWLTEKTKENKQNQKDKIENDINRAIEAVKGLKD